MEQGPNATFITLGGHVEVHTYRYVYFVVMFSVYVLILSSNSTIVVLIWIHKNLHEPMYVFIAALLVNSVLFSTNIYPKLLLDFLSEEQKVSYSGCLLQFHVYYASAGSEFLLLAAMAYDRHASICEPLRYRSIMSRSSVGAVLVLAWLLPVCSAAVPVALSVDMSLCNLTLNGIFCNNSIYSLYCVTSEARSVYGVMGLVFTALLPLLFILFTYTRILIITCGGGRVGRKAAQACLPHLLVLLSFSCLSVFDIAVVRLGSKLPKTAHFILSLQVILYHPLLNPVIYGLKMKEISKHLRRLLC